MIKNISLVLLLVVLASLPGLPVARTSAGGPPDPASPVGPSAPAGSAIVIDHTCTDISKIPEYWLTKAKELSIHYAHTSHGSQIVTGIDKLQETDSRYAFAIDYAGSTPPISLPGGPGQLRVYDGNPPETYIEPGDYWQSASGLDRTRAVANTGLFKYSMWSWCGQQSSNSVDVVQQYLDAMNGLEGQYPNMRFIYMTGHTDGGGDTLARNNTMVRDYVQAHGKVLYDFADIESYDPAGNYYPDTSDACPWCANWCSTHPQDCQNLAPDGQCAHTHSFNCKIKANAFWWMMARLAGWPGPGATVDQSSKQVSDLTPTTGQAVTFTIRLANAGDTLVSGVALTEVIPSGLTYVPGSLSASSGTANEGGAPTLRWSGNLGAQSTVTIVYAATVAASSRALIVSPTDIRAEGYTFPALRSVLVVDGYLHYLPFTMRQ